MNCLVPGSKFYLFKPSDNNEAQRWRSDGHRCFNNARMDTPKGNPVVAKIYFYLETEQGINKEFRKHVFFKMNSSLGSFLLHYNGGLKTVSTIGWDQQINNRDYGLFSIAYATELAFKGDPVMEGIFHGQPVLSGVYCVAVFV